ncbi:MAG TPA: isochorismatase family protein [Dehalococcoidia bacterium]|nr:isochorismatase family protein [Dehalococcoidia bacterium]
MSLVHSLPYAWPYHGAIRLRQTALVVCNDGEAEDAEPALAKLASVVAAARACGVRVVHLPGAKSKTLLESQPSDLVVVRPGLGGFTGTDLDLVLRTAGLTDLLLAGFPMELGADCTMREANDLGYECLLLADCCSSLSDETREGAVSSVQMSGGIFGVVANAGAVIDALEQA